MRPIRFAGLAIAGALAAAVYGGLASGSLSISGNSVPTNFITENGRVYVPLADVAKALNMNMAKSGSGYSLAPAGGANQVQGLTGKVGQVLNCGYATLEVVKVTVTDKYNFEFSQGSDAAYTDKDEIVAIHLRVKNATQKTMTIGYGGGEHSALVDNDSHSYEILSGPGSKDVPDGTDLLPGSAKDFAVAFRIPKTETPSELVYGVYFYQLSNKDLKQFRIDLTP